MISVIIPVYNAEKFVGRALESLINQTHKDFEVLVVDDCSTDRSLVACTCYDDLRIRIFKHSHRQGVGAARNTGLTYCHGDKIFFLDADDYLLPHALEMLDKGKGDIVVGGVFRQGPDGEVVKLNPPTVMDKGELDKNDITGCVNEYLGTNDCYLVSHCWGRLYDRGFLDYNCLRFNNMKVGEDLVFNIQCLTYAEKVTVIPEPLYCFQMHGNSSSKQELENDGSSVMGNIDMLGHHLNHYFLYNKVIPHILIPQFIEYLKLRTAKYGNHKYPPMSDYAMKTRQDLLIERIKDANLPIIIYGADQAGKDLLAICRKNELGVVGFADHKRELRECGGLPVIHSSEVKDGFTYLISAMSIGDVVGNLMEHGISSWLAGGLLLKKDDPIRITHEAYLKPNHLFLRSVDIMITERCSLKCRDCSNLMQYFQKPVDFDVNEVITHMDRLMETVDEVLELRILGGDAFMHPGWGKVVDVAVRYKKVRKVVIYTNGVIVPRDIAPLINPKVIVAMTNYGDLSKNFYTLISTFKNHGVKYKVATPDVWIDCSSIKKHGRMIEENNRLFKDCVATNLITMVDGKLFRCPYAASAWKLGIGSWNAEDRVGLYNKELIMKYITSKNSMSICDYCDGRILTNTITPAVQIKKAREI